MEQTLQGTVVWYRPDAGYGFIRGDGRQFFVHKSEIQGDKQRLYANQKVEFQPSEGDKGEKAVNVRPL